MVLESLKSWLLIGAFFSMVILVTRSSEPVEEAHSARVFFTQPDSRGEESKGDQLIAVQQNLEGATIRFKNLHESLVRIPKKARWAFRSLQFNVRTEDCRFVGTSPQSFYCERSDKKPLGRFTKNKFVVDLYRIRSGIFTGRLMGQGADERDEEIFVTEIEIGLGGFERYTERLYSDPTSVVEGEEESASVAKQ